MNTSLLRRARQHFCHPMAPVRVQRHNVLSWARAVHRLGDRWLLAKPVERKQ